MVSSHENSHAPWLEKLDFHHQVEYDIIQPMISWLCDGQNLHILDAGCGTGTTTLLFANQGCMLVGVDQDETALQNANKLLEQTSHVGQVVFQRGNVNQLPFEDDTFDMVWTSYVLHHIADKLHVVGELKRVLKPGGRLAIREGGLPLQMLPHDIGLGEPGLQDRLRVAQNTWFTAMTRHILPDEKPYPFGWSQLLLDSKFTDVQARTFVTDFLPPFNKAQQQFILHYFQRTLDRDDGKYGPLLNDADKKTLEQLTNENSETFILKRRDLHVRYGLSVYLGVKPA
ncbi:MAG: hypothetical protein GFH27_549287n194 [Chloroflexi bacterium AL-W]|nr:hypothetical protein [Chloroflexi bacterium AL-N1]NOK66468.1 hypothetical protein [Chloroflexi bacterium AL-N10]NOK71856.1 hypothetical protein [Chloroflexi bacterium AL-N5]NOK81113.1 hypothetical protein [Chloroflexi bacterium AL-W]NOK89386.1 hypothetical protein [Chloroflexi bacterium AL-N15]